MVKLFGTGNMYGRELKFACLRSNLRYDLEVRNSSPGSTTNGNRERPRTFFDQQFILMKKIDDLFLPDGS